MFKVDFASIVVGGEVTGIVAVVGAWVVGGVVGASVVAAAAVVVVVELVLLDVLGSFEISSDELGTDKAGTSSSCDNGTPSMASPVTTMGVVGVLSAAGSGFLGAPGSITAKGS